MSKKKKNKRKYRFSREEFIDVICSRCEICTNPNAEFCFDGAYNIDPRKFNDEVIERLENAKTFFTYAGYRNISTDCSDEDIENFLIETFCETNACGMSIINRIQGTGCINTAMCLHTLRKQLRGHNISQSASAGRRLSKKERKELKKQSHTQKRVVKYEKPKMKDPTPTFFCRAGFEEEVKRILNEDNSGE